MDSDSSTYNLTTFSEDERFEKRMEEKKRMKLELEKKMESERQTYFRTIFETNDPDSIFNLPGMRFLKFSNSKIKFSFEPCRVAKMVSSRAMFYISLKYVNQNWSIKRDSIPINYHLKVYALFYTKKGRSRFNDDNICHGIKEIWSILVGWTKNEHKYRKRKLERFRKGEDLYIDTDDEDLFLSDSEIQELHRRREEIWQRMLPPPQQRKASARPKRK